MDPDMPKSGRKRVQTIEAYKLCHVVLPHGKASANYKLLEGEDLLEVPLEDVMDDPTRTEVQLPTLRKTDASPSSPSKADLLTDLLAPLSATGRASLISSLSFRLLIKTAKEQGYDAVLLEDSMDDLAAHTLSNIALGRGASLGEEVAHCYSHNGALSPCQLLWLTLCKASSCCGRWPSSTKRSSVS
jgi:hypothetical protein